MLRRYLVALVGAIVGGGVVVGIYYFALDSEPDYRAAVGAGLAVAGFLMAKGESLGLVPPSEEVGSPTSLFTDEKGRRR
jgi:hypothetical protein